MEKVNIFLWHISRMVFCLGVSLRLVERFSIVLVMNIFCIIMTLFISSMLGTLEFRRARKVILTQVYSCVLTLYMCIIRAVMGIRPSFKLVLSEKFNQGISCELSIHLWGVLILRFSVCAGSRSTRVFSSLVDVVEVVAIFGLTLSRVLIRSIFIARLR